MARAQLSEPDPASTIRLRPSILRFWPYWLCFLLALPACVALALLLEEHELPSAFGNGARLLPWLPLAIPLIIFWKKFDVRYELRPDTIVVTTGILSLVRKYSVTQYSNLLGAEARQSIIGMLFRFADLSVGTADTGQTEFSLRGVRNWRFILAVIKARIDRAHAREAGPATRAASVPG